MARSWVAAALALSIVALVLAAAPAAAQGGVRITVAAPTTAELLTTTQFWVFVEGLNDTDSWLTLRVVTSLGGIVDMGATVNRTRPTAMFQLAIGYDWPTGTYIVEARLPLGSNATVRSAAVAMTVVEGAEAWQGYIRALTEYTEGRRAEERATMFGLVYFFAFLFFLMAGTFELYRAHTLARATHVRSWYDKSLARLMAWNIDRAPFHKLEPVSVTGDSYGAMRRRYTRLDYEAKALMEQMYTYPAASRRMLEVQAQMEVLHRAIQKIEAQRGIARLEPLAEVPAVPVERPPEVLARAEAGGKVATILHREERRRAGAEPPPSGGAREVSENQKVVDELKAFEAEPGDSRVRIARRLYVAAGVVAFILSSALILMVIVMVASQFFGLTVAVLRPYALPWPSDELKYAGGILIPAFLFYVTHRARLLYLRYAGPGSSLRREVAPEFTRFD